MPLISSVTSNKSDELCAPHQFPLLLLWPNTTLKQSQMGEGKQVEAEMMIMKKGLESVCWLQGQRPCTAITTHNRKMAWPGTRSFPCGVEGHVPCCCVGAFLGEAYI